MLHAIVVPQKTKTHLCPGLSILLFQRGVSLWGETALDGVEHVGPEDRHFGPRRSIIVVARHRLENLSQYRLETVWAKARLQLDAGDPAREVVAHARPRGQELRGFLVFQLLDERLEEEAHGQHRRGLENDAIRGELGGRGLLEREQVSIAEKKVEREALERRR